MLLLLATLLCCTLLATLSCAQNPQFFKGRTAFIQTQSGHRHSMIHGNKPFAVLPSQRHTCSTITTRYMANRDDDKEEDPNMTPEELDSRRPDKQFPGFLDAMLEIPDPRLLAGDLLFILMINFLLQIANEVGDPSFWTNGGFAQPVTMPTTLLAVIVRDSKMSLAWVLGGLWNRSYSSSSVSDDATAVKTALQVWVDYCSLRILLELGDSFLLTHSTINIWMLGREAWYTAIIMSFFRLAYGRFR